MNNIRLILLLTIGIFGIETVNAQKDSGYIKLTMEEAFDLALKNSQKLKVVNTSEELAKQKTEVAKLAKLPTLSTGLTYGYISNSQIWTPSFSEHKTAEIPHHLTQFSVQASQIIFKGGEIDNNIAKTNLEEQIATLNLQKNVVDIKFLVAAKYLDIFQLQNQLKIIEENTILAKERLKNINTLFKQGMVTNNDVLRTQLQISELEIAHRKTSNDLVIINQQLNMVLGLDETLRLEPDKTIFETKYNLSDIDSELDEGFIHNQDLKISNQEISVAEKNLKIIGADRYPEVALFASNNFQRPFINTLPAIDIYSNVWQAGIGIRYNIGSLYQSPRKIKSGKIQLDQSKEQSLLLKQNIELDIRAAYIKYEEARANLESYYTNLNSANENYRIVEKKYFNQLALLTDMIDASNTKIDAEIKVSNADIAVLYSYYKLLRTKGTL